MNRQLCHAAVLLIVGVSGCASQHTQEPPGAANWEPVRLQDARLTPGRIAIVPVGYAPAPISNPSTATKGESAAAGAQTYAGKGLSFGVALSLRGVVSPLAPLWIPALPIILPVSMVVGSVVGAGVGAAKGAWQGMPAEQASALHAPIERAVRDGGLHDRVASETAMLAAGLPHYTLRQVPNIGPQAVGDEPDYQALKEQRYDAVLEVGIATLGFNARTGGDKPEAWFLMTMRARIVPLNDEARPFVHEFAYSGDYRPIAEWASDGERLLLEELTAANVDLSRKLVDAAFWPLADQ